MAPVPMSRRLPLAVALGLVAFAFWPALFGGGTLVSADLVASAPPFESYRGEGESLGRGYHGDPVNIHAHWGSLAADIRSGEVGWWNPSLAGGQPTMKGGAPVFDVAYLVAPRWYAPGLVAAVRALTAIGLAFGFLRAVGLRRVAALAGGLAFGFSGFMVGWMNWPHSSVAALAPGLLWAIERLLRDPRPWRAVPLGVVAALMVWSNFPSVLIYVLLGVAAYAAVRGVSEWRGPSGPARLGRGGAVAVLALAIAALLAAPHVVGFSEYVDWADTSHRVGNPDDSSAGAGYLLTAVAPAIWGSDAVGAPWFGEGNWVEFNTHVGASVVVLAALGFVAGLRSTDRRRRSVAFGLAVMAGLGVMIAYVGGPVGVALGDVTGSEGGVMTRAKVLLSLGLTLGAALGVDRLVGDESDEGGAGGRERSLRRDVVLAGALLAAVTLVLLPSLLNWVDVARGLGVFRQTIAASAAPMLALVAAVVIIGARVTRRMPGAMAGWALIVVLGFELLSFAMPVPTIVDRGERLTSTPAHDVVHTLLAPGERLAGEGRTFFPSTTQLFDIDDARGQVLKSAGYQELLRAVDPDMLTRAGGGIPTSPNIAAGTDPTSPVWDALAVGLWAQTPDQAPYGTRREPALVADDADPASTVLRGETVVPAGGLRGVLVRVVPLTGGFVDVSVTTDDGTTTERRWLEPSDLGVEGFAVLGEHLTVGSTVVVEISSPASSLLVGVDADGSVPIGTVAGDDDLELVRIGDVILLDRPVEPVRLVAGATIEADPTRAAAAVASGATVIDRDLGLPAISDPDAMPAVRSVERDGTDRLTVEVEADRDAVLVVSITHYPGWSARVDGVDTPVVVANGAFLGVPVAAGAHRVELEFRPDHLRLDLISILLGFVAVGAVLFDARRRGHLRSSPRSAG